MQAKGRLGDLEGNIFSQVSKAYKKAVPKSSRNLVGGALIATAVGGGAYAAGLTPSKIAEYFRSTGMSQVAANAAADSIISGQQPLPPDLAAHLGAQQAGLFGGMDGWIIPIAIIGLGGVALFMLPKKGGRRAR